MPKNVITAHALSKQYIIPHTAHSDTFREFLKNTFALKRRAGPHIEKREKFWALREVSFSIKQGEKVAIIGVNGSGKSTLLKILSRVVIPTTGTATIAGRVSSLLELGVGFHPDLTGRENIALNATLLGATKKEIQHNFDDIVEFAEVSHFIDLPIKRYSNGMKARLGFSIAFHVRSDILIVDEVLAVGDFLFREKCMRRIRALCEAGQTLLFVSHGSQNLLDLCTRGIVLSHGRVVCDDTINNALDYYTTTFRSYPQNIWSGTIKNATIAVRRLELRQPTPNATDGDGRVFTEAPAELSIQYELFCDISHFRVGVELLSAHTLIERLELPIKEYPQFHAASRKGTHTLLLTLSLSHHPAGDYAINMLVSSDNAGNLLTNAPSIAFSYQPTDYIQTPTLTYHWDIRSA